MAESSAPHPCLVEAWAWLRQRLEDAAASEVQHLHQPVLPLVCELAQRHGFTHKEQLRLDWLVDDLTKALQFRGYEVLVVPDDTTLWRGKRVSVELSLVFYVSWHTWAR